jgi:hypothetical protein
MIFKRKLKLFCKKETKDKHRFREREKMIEKIISEFDDIFKEFNPSFYNSGVRFQGKIRWNQPFYNLSITVMDPYTNLAEGSHFDVTEWDTPHRLHLRVYQVIINSIKQLEKNIKEEFKQQMKDQEKENDPDTKEVI